MMEGIPGFTAEMSLHRPSGHYRSWRFRLPGGGTVYPAQLPPGVGACPLGWIEVCRDECIGGHVFDRCVSWEWQPLDPSTPSPWGRQVCTGTIPVCTGVWVRRCGCERVRVELPPFLVGRIVGGP
jgi:hypothetical protein